MSVPDPRAVSLILFQYLSRQLSELEDLDPQNARVLINKGLSLIPGLNVEGDPKSDVVTLRFDDDPDEQEIPFSIRDAIDSLMVLWRDYSRLHSGEGGRH
ncbi:MAG: hypothetical protein KDK37_09480 [Leptospiraceae bacterium]|nr:hypothetical protein [Leptospiraceae bacterium]MCB1304498.1 hypothetical protein [Leptospiraceae bacterium]